MRRSTSLATLTLLCGFLTVATYEARQPRPEIAEVREIAQNLYVLLNDPDSRNMQTGGNTAVFVTATGVVLVDTKPSQDSDFQAQPAGVRTLVQNMYNEQ